MSNRVPLLSLKVLTRIGALAAIGLCLMAPVFAQTNLIVNPGFDRVDASSLPLGWSAVWMRDPGAVTASIDSQNAHIGRASLKIVSAGSGDWSFSQTALVPVHPGEIYLISGWIKCRAVDTAQLSVVTRDGTGNVIDWEVGPVETHGSHDWAQFSSRLLIPQGCATIQFRLTGVGEGTTWLDDAVLEKIGDLDALRKKWNGRAYRTESPSLEVVFDPVTGALAVTDRRTRHVWSQFVDDEGCIVQSVRQASGSELDVSLVNATGDTAYSATIMLPADSPQLRVTISGCAALPAGLRFPQPFATRPGDKLVMPMNEGMLFPVDDPSIERRTLEGFQGHGGLSMPWAGVTEADGSGVMLLLRTPDDAQVDMNRDAHGLLYLRPEWVASRGQFGYPRKLTYVFFTHGGYVAQAKWYRAYAMQTGLFKTLAEKRKANPNVDKLVGAVDVWAWVGAEDAVPVCKEMRSLGMDHILWSAGGSPANIAAINALGYLTGKYDQYQDEYPPGSGAEMFPAKWPDDLEQQPDGSMTLGWLGDVRRNGVDTKVQAGVCNAKREVEIASVAIPEDLKTTKYTARFLDTDTASPWREDYNPLHPMTRSQDRYYRMKLLALCSQDLKLVTGSETGIDTAVPYLDYFEGMMSISAYRYPDSGRNIQDIVEPTPDILKYMVGPEYRIPLFELVYHDCVVDYWYWGDYTNKMPAVWPQRDLFNILYGTPPEFMFDRALWEKNKVHFAQTYKDVCPLVRRLGYQEMLSHAFLTQDHTVQQTRWSDGTVVTVNFGDSPYHLTPGQSVEPMSWLVTNGHGAASKAN